LQVDHDIIPPPNDVDRLAVRYVRSYTTHIVTVEADMIERYGVPVYINLTVAGYTTETFDFGELDPADYERAYTFGGGINADITKTAWYKNCNANNPIFVNCGYVVAYDNTENGRSTVSWQGKVVYTSPTRAEGDWMMGSCCGAASMLVISTMLKADAMSYKETEYDVYIEGNHVYSVKDSPTVTCCATHGGAYRYGLLRVQYLTETADIGEDTMTLTDGTHAERDNGDTFVTSDGVSFRPDEAIAKKTITDDRQRMLFCNGHLIGTNKRYDGLYCCGDYMICVYVDDDYLSGWDDLEVTTIENKIDDDVFIQQIYTYWHKWSANPGWAEKSPPPAKNRKEWDKYNADYPGFAVDVFYEGKHVGNFKLSDANSPVCYDHLQQDMRMAWLIMAVRLFGLGIGQVPWSLEGTPKCRANKLLLPYDGGLQTCINDETERKVFP
jgi:hypothetical protein